MDNIMKFLHIPKTAGQSVAKAIGNPASYLGHNPISLTDTTDDIITVVRNPYDRAVSMYYYLKDIQGDHLQELFQTLNGFWNRIYTAPKSGIEHRHMKPQMWYLKDHDGNVSSQVTILKYETLQEDFNQLAALNGFAGIDHLNKSYLRPNTTWQEELNEESIHAIGELYADDFEHLGYERLL